MESEQKVTEPSSLQSKLLQIIPGTAPSSLTYQEEDGPSLPLLPGSVYLVYGTHIFTEKPARIFTVDAQTGQRMTPFLLPDDFQAIFTIFPIWEAVQPETPPEGLLNN